MAKKSFNLFSLTGQRLYRELQGAKGYSLDSHSINQIAQILFKNNIHLISRPRLPNYEAQNLAKNLNRLDPYAIHYIVRSEAEFNLLELLDGNPLFTEASDIVEALEKTEFSFVENPYSSMEKIWCYDHGSAPVFVTETNTHVKPSDPIIQKASRLGLDKSMRYTY